MFDFIPYKVHTQDGRYNKLGLNCHQISFQNESADNRRLLNGLMMCVGKVDAFPGLNEVHSVKLSKAISDTPELFSLSKIITDDLLNHPCFIPVSEIPLVLIENYFWAIDSIAVQSWSHKPSIVKHQHDPQDLSFDKFEYEWIFPDQEKFLSRMFSYVSSPKVEASFLVDLEFEITKSYSDKQQIKDIFKLNGIRIVASCEGANFYICDNHRVEILESDAHEFLQREAQLFALEQLGENDELNNLEHRGLAKDDDSIDPDLEINDLKETVQILKKDFENIIKYRQDESPYWFGNYFDEAHGFAFYYNDALKFLTTLSELDVGGREAISSIIAQKSIVIEQNDTFNKLSPRAKNNISGHAFENLMAGKVIAEGLKKRVLLERIEGDGIGVLPNGNKTPLHCDLVFKDGIGRMHSFQLKFSDSKQNIEKMVREFYSKHGNNPNNSGYYDLDIENTIIIVPKGLEDVITHVQINGNVRDIVTMSEINIGAIKADANSVEGVRDFLKRHYEAMRKLNKETLIKIKTKQIEIIEKLTKRLTWLQDTCSHLKDPDVKANLIAKIQKTSDEIDKTKSLIAETDKKIECKSRYLNLEDLLKAIGAQFASAFIISAISTFVISMDKHFYFYYKGGITKDEFLSIVGAKTKVAGKAAFKSGAIAAGMGAAGVLFQFLATSSSKGVSLVGAFLVRILGPALLIKSLAFQAFDILNRYKSKEITSFEMKKQYGRMFISASISFSGSYGSAFLLGSTKRGWLIGFGANILAPIVDFYLGDKIASFFWTIDCEEAKRIIQRNQSDLEKEVLINAYDLFNQTEFCTDKELKEAYKAALLKYHPDKSIGGEEEKRKCHNITLAILSTYSLLEKKRKKLADYCH